MSRFLIGVLVVSAFGLGSAIAAPKENKKADKSATPAAPAAAAPAAASDGANLPQAVRDAIQKQYGADAKIESGGERDVNGNHAYSARIDTEEGNANALFAENGDIIMANRPSKGDEQVPTFTKQLVTALFGDVPAKHDVTTLTLYDAYIPLSKEATAAGVNTRVRVLIDPVGRVTDIQSLGSTEEQTARAMEMPVRNSKSLKAASDADNAAVQKAVAQRIPGAKITQIYIYPEKAGNFVVDYEENGVAGQIVTDKNGKVYAASPRALAKNDVPAPVRATLDQLFKGTNINDVRRETITAYTFEEQSANGGDIAVRVRPNGDVMQVITHGPRGEAIPAAEKQAPAKP